MNEHERVSELLGPLVRGELTASEKTELEAHLATCPECAAEKRALEALLSPLPEEGMNDLERARLHRGIEAELGLRTSSRNPWPTVARWMGAAAMLALVAVGITQIEFTGSDSDEAGSGADTALESAEGAATAPVQRGGPDIAPDDSSEVFGSDSDASGAASAPETLVTAEEDLSDGDGGAERVPARFDPDAGSFTGRDLERFAAREAPFTTFADTYSASDADELAPAYVNALAGAPRGQANRTTLRRCAELVLQQDFPIILAYGAHGRFKGREVLVLGFVSTASEGPLRDYLVWVWPRGECDTPMKILRGRVTG